MKKNDLWKLYVSKNPHFERDEKITLKKDMLRKLFDQTFDAGYEEHKRISESMKKLDSVFGNVFGRV